MRLNRFFIFVTIFLSLSLSGCILDSLEEVPLDIPQTYPFGATGDDVTVIDDGAFCLTDNELYTDYESKINDIKLLAITFRPTEVTPANLKGDVRLIIRKTNAQGEVLFDYTYPNITPAAYLPPETPYELPVTGLELSLLNNYLKANGTCFYVAVMVENITPSGTKTIKGFVDFVFRTTTDLG